MMRRIIFTLRVGFAFGLRTLATPLTLVPFAIAKGPDWKYLDLPWKDGMLYLWWQF